MALRARLSPPRPATETWRWHQAKFTSVSASLLMDRERRMEAENYLAGGYGMRLALESQADGWAPLKQVARTWQPHRLKGIQVSKRYGTPFLAATQVFDLRPTPRKWLSLDRTEQSNERFVTPGMILVTCSGNVGRATVAFDPHAGILVSHDLLRVEPIQPGWWGWLYAYLRSPQAHAMMLSAQYGHIIKHLETHHLDALPVPLVTVGLQESFTERCKSMLEKRNISVAKLAEAEALFADAVGVLPKMKGTEAGFTVSASSLFSGRRRLEGNFYHPRAAAVLTAFRKSGKRVELLCQATERIWWMTRFKRIFGDAGVPYVSADELFSLNPPTSKRVLVEQAENAADYFVKEGWLVMACSGQTYGTNGSVALMTKHHESLFFSHDLIRIIPSSARPGYLHTALGHPELGRPLLIRYAYGTSIPHLEPSDVRNFALVRLESKVEADIADLAEAAVALRSEADKLENALAADAGILVDQLLAGDKRNFLRELA